MGEGPIVVVGGGLAAAKATEALRSEGYDDDLVVVAAEQHRPYERPPLSKDYLRGEAERESVFPLSAEWYTENEVELRLGQRASGLDAEARRVTLADGTTLPYSRLLLATGSDPRPFPVPGIDLEGVHFLRTLEQSESLAATLQDSAREGAGRLAVVGDGWIGLEVAASARTMGLEVTVIGRGAHPLERVLGPQLGEFFGQLHSRHDVHLQRDVEAVAITGSEGQVTGVETSDGVHVPADVVLVAVGAAPNIGLAEASGIAGDTLTGGLAVDGTLQTSVPGVFAAGDVASVPSPRYERSLRVEHWATALNQGPFAARSMLGALGPGEVYDRLPYFYTDQYDVGMEYLGFVDGPFGYDDLVVSGSLEEQEFVAFWLLEGRLLAGMTVNTWDQMERIEELVRRSGPADRAELESFRS